MTVKLVVGSFTLNVISAYVPQMGLGEEARSHFCQDLDEVVRGVPLTEKLFIGGNFNSHIGKDARGFNKVHVGFNFGGRNEEGTSLLEFAKAFYLLITNMKFDKGMCTNCEVIPSEFLSTQHMLLAMDLEIKRKRKRNKRAVYGKPKIKWGALTRNKAHELGEKFVDMESWKSSGDVSNVWTTTSNCIRKRLERC
ncbi:PREDICTED: uncharacterized protein LOC109206126 [Nicotiana attenuata]|uniref:uncharacterized protein LOC109206126 n=1 Tax=Nicotiana attenuata TaxID=49451 RepID=UPI000905785E|nr:PREDICTED: uncharacterized protein LOC109206126 [Nicotiana attenuata]